MKVLYTTLRESLVTSIACVHNLLCLMLCHSALILYFSVISFRIDLIIPRYS